MNRYSLFKEIEEELCQVEQELGSLVSNENLVLEEASAHLLKAGGKRLRPAFVLIAGKFQAKAVENLIPLAVALELIHMASLVHDDVIDCAYLRRGVPTVRALWGNSVSLHTGDYLFAQALILVARYNDPRILKIMADVSVKMCEGEIQQLISVFDLNQTVKDYLNRIRRKTALLISTSCALGAIASGSSEKVIRALTRYGYYLGMAFQITDDLLDFTSSEEELGKAVGSDLGQGIITLPVIYTLRQEKEKGSYRLQNLLQDLEKGEKKEAVLKEALRMIASNGSIEQAQLLAARYIKKAKAELSCLPEVPARYTLEKIADFINSRRF